MSEIVKKFSDGVGLKFGKGKFDDWCVLYVSPEGTEVAPRDTDYFWDLQDLGGKYNPDRLYNDFVKVYDMTGENLDNRVFDEISKIAATYTKSRDDALLVEKTFCVLYMGMIAEEQKEGTMLGKRIKRLGVHRILKEGAMYQLAANFMRGMGWDEIDKLCKERGF